MHVFSVQAHCECLRHPSDAPDDRLPDRRGSCREAGPVQGGGGQLLPELPLPADPKGRRPSARLHLECQCRGADSVSHPEGVCDGGTPQGGRVLCEDPVHPCTRVKSVCHASTVVPCWENSRFGRIWVDS
jgi:hypothetical protein